MDLRGWSFRLMMLHQGEGRIVFFLSMIAALTGFGLTIGRASSDALFFTQYGVDHLPLMFALIALVLIPCSLAYAAFVDRLTPYRMFVHLLLGFGVMVGTSWGVMRVEGRCHWYRVLFHRLRRYFRVVADAFQPLCVQLL